ncbi:hypothetical protein CTA2_7205 [Colletotrichum tanaceti]|uniref:Uncharacterized protein n=1 Tax=Colletotrichum tanaceti TaxID=1306861 RepID=A0A4U6XF94_9PEZI|nr:hypothetical protein CTA2_7205 [Colletotrichum tanaceti]TKW54385.1 hypothetical protein CTA1_4033 [Colletotrichum tanaceti]
MKYLTLLLAVLSILGLVAAQIPIKPPAYYGAPSTPKKKTLKRRDIGPRAGRPHVVNVANDIGWDKTTIFMGAEPNLGATGIEVNI